MVKGEVIYLENKIKEKVKNFHLKTKNGQIIKIQSFLKVTKPLEYVLNLFIKNMMKIYKILTEFHKTEV